MMTYEMWDDYYEADEDSVRIEEVEPGYWTVFSADGNRTYYFSESATDCKCWCNDHEMAISMITSL